MTNTSLNDIKKVKGNRVHKVTNSNGINEAYLFSKKLGLDAKSTIFRKTIRVVNSLLQEQLAKGEDIHLPKRMGTLELRKFRTKVELRDGKLYTNRPIDWDATIKLWCSNQKARDKKIKVRREVSEVYRIIYKKASATYNNKAFYLFSANRGLRLLLKHNIEKGNMDAFSFKTY